MKRQIDNLISQICHEDTRYSEDAYGLVMEALSFTQKKFRRQKHVTGKEFLEGIKILLMDEFGPMAIPVLRHWGIQKTEDFGNIVFNLVQKSVLSKTEQDHIEHFKNVYDFEVVFKEGYSRKLNKDVSRMR